MPSFGGWNASDDRRTDTEVRWEFTGDGTRTPEVTGPQTASVTYFGPTQIGTMLVVATVDHPWGGTYYDAAYVHLFGPTGGEALDRRADDEGADLAPPAT